MIGRNLNVESIITGGVASTAINREISANISGKCDLHQILIAKTMAAYVLTASVAQW